MSSEWTLGSTSAHRESGGRGPGTVSTGRGDHGGVSYGTYQLSSRAGTLREYLNQSDYSKQFEGLPPNSPEFIAKWKQIADADPNFGKDQHEFIKSSHYDVQRDALEARGIDLSDRGPAVQDALWSTSVQLRNLTPDIVEKGLKEKFGESYKLSDLSDRDIVEAIQDYKINHNNSLFRSSPKNWNGLLNRAREEKEDLIALAEGREVTRKPSGNDQRDAMADGVLREGERGPSVRALQEELIRQGYTDAQGRPLVADGHFGERTRQAVEAYQQAHQLDRDGVAGPDTLSKLKQTDGRAASQQANSPLLSDGNHPDNGMFVQAMTGLQLLKDGGGFQNREQLERAAATLVYEAKVSGLDSIGSVVASKDGKRLFAVDGDPGDPASKRVVTDSAQAAGQSIEQITRALNQDVAIPMPPPQGNPQQAKPIQI